MISTVKPLPLSRAKCKSLLFAVSLLLCVGACVTIPSTPRERVFNDFVIVKVESGDSFASLASKYLNDPQKGWQIAEFNHQTSLEKGQELVIPLIPAGQGGLHVDGYQTVPILTYYGFSKKKTGQLIVSESDFMAQMAFLKENGYTAITLDQLLDFIDFKCQLPNKSIVVTFDDGWRSLYDIAYPVLKECGFPATLFIYTEFIGGQKALSWDQIQELSQNGFDIQPKTRTHRDLTKPTQGESFEDYFRAIQMEIFQPKKIIEKKLKKNCRYMAYPWGKTNNLVIAIMKKEGYRAAFTSKSGQNPFFVNQYRIHRSVIQGGSSMAQFKKQLSVFTKSDLK